MARRQQCRHRSPEAVLARSEEALRRTLYIVHQAGPTSFVLREETRERKFKVSSSKTFSHSTSQGVACCHRRVSETLISVRAARSGKRESSAFIYSGR